MDTQFNSPNESHLNRALREVSSYRDEREALAADGRAATLDYYAGQLASEGASLEPIKPTKQPGRCDLCSQSLPASLISEPELRSIVETLQKLTSKSVIVENIISVTTNDVNLSAMLDTLKDALGERVSPVKVKANGHKRVAGKQETKAVGSRSMLPVNSGEILSTRELKQRLATGEMEGAVIEDSKGIRSVVLAGKLIREPQP